MTNPITPPPELVQQWIPAGWNCSPNTFTTLLMRIADNAALWSYYNCRSEIKAAADQELEACCEWLCTVERWNTVAEGLRTSRRPQPPSLKRVALLQLDTLNADLGLEGKGVDLSQIRLALEALDD